MNGKTILFLALLFGAIAALFITLSRQEAGKTPQVASGGSPVAETTRQLEQAESEGARLYAQEALERAESAAAKAAAEQDRAKAEALSKEAARLARKARAEAVSNRERGAVYVVRPGDNLWDLSRSDFAYENPWVWPLIWEANRERVSNPHHIQVGWELTIPGRRYSKNDVERSKAMIVEAEQLRVSSN